MRHSERLWKTMSDYEKEEKIMSDSITHSITHSIAHSTADCPEMPQKFIFRYNSPTWRLYTTWKALDEKTNQVSDTMTICPWCGVELYSIIPRKNTGVVIQTYCRVDGNTGVKTENVQVKLDVATPVPNRGSKVELTWTGKN